VGKLGDLVVLDRDPLHVPPETIKDIQVQMTVMGGQITYADQTSPGATL